MNTYDQLKQQLYDYIKLYSDECIAFSDDLGLHPEISGEEYKSSKKLATLLNDRGFTVEYPFAGIPTAFKAVSDNGSSRNICILAEYDALPDIGHACGHNVSAAISLLAALSLKPLQSGLDANIHVIGTPREESDGAKCIMTDMGCFDGYDMAMMVHLYDSNNVAPRFYAMDLFKYTFYGVSSHSAIAPWEGKNALNGVTLMFHALDMLRQHVKPDVRIHGIIRNGGQFPNMVPVEASCEMYIRSLDRDYLNTVVKMVDDCAKGAAYATQTTYEKIKIGEPNHNLKNNDTGNRVLHSVFEELGLPIQVNKEGTFGSSDVGTVSMVCPTFHPTLQIADPGTALHTKAFADAALSERAHCSISIGAKIIGLHILKVFTDKKLYSQMLQDFKN